VNARQPTSEPRAARLLRIRRRLLDWYAIEHRDFPWRQTSDPWAVLVSEVMLQQTQASRVAERFPQLLARFPTPHAIATTSAADVLAAWSGLGYNRRALALQRAGAIIAAEGWPPTVAGLERLPGVGRYTARAVSALAFGQAVGAVDTNVRRWLVRRFGLDATASIATLQPLADRLAAAAGRTTTEETAAWMHASMEFGARVCSARAPSCPACPVRHGCPSRGRDVGVPVKRQPAFSGSERAVRGRLIRALAMAPGHDLPLAQARRLADIDDFDGVMARLARDGLAHRSGPRVRLGAPARPRPLATIEP
jgi:A/G-specific adenine glycosylase